MLTVAATLAESFRLSQDRIGTNSAAFTIDGVHVDFAIYRYPHLAPVDEIENVRMWSLPDVISMKLGPVCNRGAKKDLFDSLMLIEQLGLPEIIAIYRRKFPENDPAIVLRSLCYFDDAESDVDPVSLVDATWPKVKKHIAAEVKKLL